MTARSEVDPPTSINNQENAQETHTHTQAGLPEAVFQLSAFFPGMAD